MAKTLAAFMTFLLIFINKPLSQEQEDISVRSVRNDRIFEYTSAPGAPDLIEMLSDYDYHDWDTARQYMRTIKLYYYHATKYISPEILELIHGNTFQRLAERGAFKHIRHNFQIKTALEVPAMKPENCLFIPHDIQWEVELMVDSVINIYQAGGNVHRLDIDTAIGHCGATVDDSSFAVSRFMMLAEDAIYNKLAELKTVNPDLPIVQIRWAEIEAYPHKRIKDHIRYIDRMNLIRERLGYLPIEVYFLDIDQRILRDYQLIRDFDSLISYCHSKGIKVGIIINGDDEDPKDPWMNKDLEYLRSANIRLARFKRLGILDKADIIMVQSWADEANGNKTVPRNVPETAITGTNFFIHVLKCAFEVSDCDIYPELR